MYPELEGLCDGGDKAEQLAQDPRVGVLRLKVADALGTSDLGTAFGGSPWRAGLVEAHIAKSGDPETGLPKWLRSGAPVGVTKPVEPCGIFPPATREKEIGDVQDVLTSVWSQGNYKSFDEARPFAEPELERIISEGYAEDLGTWQKR